MWGPAQSQPARSMARQAARGVAGQGPSDAWGGRRPRGRAKPGPGREPTRVGHCGVRRGARARRRGQAATALPGKGRATKGGGGRGCPSPRSPVASIPCHHIHVRRPASGSGYHAAAVPPLDPPSRRRIACSALRAKRSRAAGAGTELRTRPGAYGPPGRPAAEADAGRMAVEWSNDGRMAVK